MDNLGLGRRLLVGLVVLTAAGLLATVNPRSAEAATGAGYCAGRKVRTLPFSAGSVWVFKGNGYVCAVTFAKKAGAARPMAVSVQARGSRPGVDKGRYRHHAGPVTVHAGHRCVRVRGSVGKASADSGWILC
ncbi:hypothetical protein AB0L85_00850 [Streptomyces sp. NPDC052051]|uniref:hypothetical protein n=1 Tax=Streptomyces sp. NPDC052051 TaxID=3154649 RepID=UPI003421A9B4